MGEAVVPRICRIIVNQVGSVGEQSKSILYGEKAYMETGHSSLH